MTIYNTKYSAHEREKPKSAGGPDLPQAGRKRRDVPGKRSAWEPGSEIPPNDSVTYNNRYAAAE